MKSANINEDTLGEFILDYEDTLGRRIEMRLDASTYESALRQARSFLGIDETGHDPDGDLWVIE